jgi:hypothetical protein
MSMYVCMYVCNTAIQFLKDICLLPADMQCPSCRSDMRWCSRPRRSDGLSRPVVKLCGNAIHGWFSGSCLTLMNIIMLSYYIMRLISAQTICLELQVDHHTVLNIGSSAARQCWTSLSFFMKRWGGGGG